MKTLLQLVMVGILGFASVAHAAGPFCWSLSAPGVGTSATTLKLYGSDMGGQLILSGTASYSLVTFPVTDVVLLLVGTAVLLNGNIEAALEGKGASPSSRDSLLTQDYYLILNPASLDGGYISNTNNGTATSIPCN